MSFVVLDTWRDESQELMARWTGRVLGQFLSFDRAKKMTLRRMALGDLGVVVVDTETGTRVFP